MEPLGPTRKIKETPQSFSYISRNGTSLRFQETKTQRKFFTFQEVEVFYISEMKTLQKLLTFQRVIFRAPKVKRTHS